MSFLSVPRRVATARTFPLALFFAATTTVPVFAQDECAGAIAVITGVNGPFSSVGMTTSAPAWPCGGGGTDMWFSYVASCNGTATFDTCAAGRTNDTTLQVFGHGCGSLQSRGCNDDACGLGSRVTTLVAAGSTYHIRVGSFASGAGGTFSLTIACAAAAPPNDECATATAVSTGLNGPFYTNGATTSFAWSGACVFGGANDIWFSWVASCTGNATIDLCTGRTYDTCLEVFDGSGGCGAIASLACNDDFCSLGSQVTVPVTLGTTYYIRAGGFNSQVGTCCVNIVCVGGGPDDECAGATGILDGLNGPFTNVGYTTSAPAWPCGGGGRDRWFVYTATCTAAVTFDTCTGTNYDSTIEVFDGAGGCAALVSLACNDDFCGLLSSATIATTQFATYYVRVGGFGGGTGIFGLTATPTGGPANDECAGAIALPAGANGPFSTSPATDSAPAWPCAGGGCDVWYSHTACMTGTLTVSTCNPARTYDTALEGFSGACGALTSLACNDDAGGACGLGSTMAFPVTFGQTYYIRVGGFVGFQGQFQLDISYTGGMGSFTTTPTGCGAATLGASGGPTLGGTVTYSIAGLVGLPMMWFGPAIGPIPLCLPAPCQLGANFLIVLNGLPTIAVTVPCDPLLLGASISTQAADLGAPGGCTVPIPFTLTDTINTTIL